MPLITLSLEAGRTRKQKRQLADAVYEALRAAIQIPENDRFVAIREHAAGAGMSKMRMDACWAI